MLQCLTKIFILDNLANFFELYKQHLPPRFWAWIFTYTASTLGSVGGGSCIGYKRIEQIGPVEVDRVALEVKDARGRPLIRKLAVFGAA